MGVTGAEVSILPQPSPVAKLRRILAVERNDLYVIGIYEAAVGIFSLVVPITIQSLVNTVVFNFLLQPIVVLAAVLIFFLFLASTLKLVQMRVIETVQTRIFTRISMDLAYRLPRLRMEAFDTHRGTELLNRFFEVVTIQKGLALLLVDGLSIVLQSMIGMVLLAFYHPALLVFDVILVICIVGIVFIPSKAAIKTSLKECSSKYTVASWLEEIARNPVAFKLGGAQEYALKRANECTLEYLGKRRSHFRVLIGQISGTLMVQTLLSGLFLGLGSWLVIKKQLTLGQLVASEIIVTMVLSRFAKLGKYIETYYDLVTSVDKITSLFQLPLEKSARAPFVPDVGGFSINLKEVSFNYPGTVRRALDSVNLTVSAGEKIGIVGGNGSGKSTIFDLILGLRPCGSGSLEVSGLDLRDFNADEMRRYVGLVRHIELIEGTILENIQLGRPGITVQVVRTALESVGLLDAVSSLPDGLATRLSGGQNPLSAGQAQLLMLARALAGSPKLLLLDEALDDIDPVARQRVVATVFDPKAPWTVIVASHNALGLTGCTRLYDLSRGVMSEAATPQRGL